MEKLLIHFLFIIFGSLNVEVLCDQLKMLNDSNIVEVLEHVQLMLVVT